MTPEERAILERFAPRRPVQLTEAEAAELGTDALLDWRTAPTDSWIVDVVDYAELITDAARYRRAKDTAIKIGIGFGAGAVCVGVIFVLSIVLGTMG